MSGSIEQNMSCPSCASTDGLVTFYSVTNVPLQSAVLLNTVEEALTFPTGDLHLTYCTCCELVFNAVYDEAQIDYSVGYEVSQAHSPTFVAFATDLTKRWIKRYELTGKHVVEIGCGNGDFLALMCKHGPSHGTGFDPASDAGRVIENVKLVSERLTDQNLPSDADFLVCRHTLEHIEDVNAFLKLLSKAAQPCGASIGVEVPDIQNIIDQNAFWDLYYEHACYFSGASLSNALGLAGFKVDNVYSAFGDQYLIAEATLDPAKNFLIKPNTHRPQWLNTFRHLIPHQINSWKTKFAAWERQGKRVCLWGSGSKAVGFLTTLQMENAVDCIVDVNPARQGFFMPKVPAKIVSPDELGSRDVDVVIVMNPNYGSEIIADLQNRNLNPEIVMISEFASLDEAA